MGVRISPPVQINIKMAIINYIKESFQELRENVTWPTWAETQRLSIVVAVFSIIFALLTWGVDEFFVKALEGFFNIIK